MICPGNAVRKPCDRQASAEVSGLLGGELGRGWSKNHIKGMRNLLVELKFSHRWELGWRVPVIRNRVICCSAFGQRNSQVVFLEYDSRSL